MKRAVVTLFCAAVMLSACQRDHDHLHGSAPEASLRTTAKAAQRLLPAHSEIAAFADMMFKKYDINQDGIVTQAERAKAPNQRWLMDFNKLDLDGNGELTRDEYIRAVIAIHRQPRGLEV